MKVHRSIHNNVFVQRNYVQNKSRFLPSQTYITSNSDCRRFTLQGATGQLTLVCPTRAPVTTAVTSLHPAQTASAHPRLVLQTSPNQVWPLPQFFNFCKISMFCLKEKSMTPHRRRHCSHILLPADPCLGLRPILWAFCGDMTPFKGPSNHLVCSGTSETPSGLGG